MIKLILLHITGCCTCQPGVAGTTVPARGRDERWTGLRLDWVWDIAKFLDWDWIQIPDCKPLQTFRIRTEFGLSQRTRNTAILLLKSDIWFIVWTSFGLYIF